MNSCFQILVDWEDFLRKEDCVEIRLVALKTCEKKLCSFVVIECWVHLRIQILLYWTKGVCIGPTMINGPIINVRHMAIRLHYEKTLGACVLEFVRSGPQRRQKMDIQNRFKTFIISYIMYYVRLIRWIILYGTTIKDSLPMVIWEDPNLSLINSGLIMWIILLIHSYIQLYGTQQILHN